TGTVDTELRARGIYKARLYKSESQVSGQIRVPANYGIDQDLADYRFEQPFLAVGISDIRGIGNALKLRLNGQTLDFQPGSSDRLLDGGVHVLLAPLQANLAQNLDFAFELKLQGTSSLSIT
ncbi:cell envelope integrity protein CreD, partial [Pseudomonas sp. MOB-449]|nr:cell envelope integrity protein CreD [Pseudomonas sp. MOB-449]